MNYLIIDY